MTHPFALISVFTSAKQGFRGNISAVVLLDKMKDTATMQQLAADFNQPATTFLAPGPTGEQFNIRWFAPDAEIPLCGHGAMAAIAYLSDQFTGSRDFQLNYTTGQIAGRAVSDHHCEIALESIAVQQEQPPFPVLQAGLGIPVRQYFVTANKHIVLAQSESDVRKMQPDFAKLRESEVFGYAVTAPGDEVDFVSRTLVPHVQQLEDHATGSSHAVLTPFWAKRLGKKTMTAHQLSPRGGRFQCKYDEQRVFLSGGFRTIASGTCQCSDNDNTTNI